MNVRLYYTNILPHRNGSRVRSALIDMHVMMADKIIDHVETPENFDLVYDVLMHLKSRDLDQPKICILFSSLDKNFFHTVTSIDAYLRSIKRLINAYPSLALTDVEGCLYDLSTSENILQGLSWLAPEGEAYLVNVLESMVT